ncbi:MAG: twin-arginine translocase TatA/TatE family subunit [Chloroflexi bacterium]|nr:twin-arginine translocase TatA/TatE family subunit [Chloroflexota bacterium]
MGPLELVLIGVIVLLVFGVGKLPEVGKALGKGLRSFKKAQDGDFDNDEDDEKEVKVEAVAPNSAQAPEPVVAQAPEPVAERASEADKSEI